jgi:hypothetical protein
MPEREEKPAIGDRPRQQLLLKMVAIATVPLFCLGSVSSSLAIIPDQAEVFQILGNNDLGIRRRSAYGPAQIGALLNRGDTLHIPGSGRSFAKLRFQRAKRDLGLQVQASTKNQRITLYYFPCRFLQGDAMIIEWANEKTGWRGCERGIRVQRGGQQRAQSLEFPRDPGVGLMPQLKAQGALAQVPRGRREFCSAIAADGRSWLGTEPGDDPCAAPLQQCKTSGGKDCVEFTRDSWTLKATDLQATIICADQPAVTAKATGSTFPEVVTKLWQQTQKAKFCGLQVMEYDRPEVIVVPQNRDRTLVQTRNTPQGIEVDVMAGAATVFSSQKPQGNLVTAGQRYVYVEQSQSDRVESFDVKRESIELQVYQAVDRGFKLCDQEQVSGGQQGDEREIQLTATEGELRIDYEMYTVPDRLKLSYENRTLVDTNFVSGGNRIAVKLQGNSGRVKVQVIGNQIESTKWKYTLFCPQ